MSDPANGLKWLIGVACCWPAVAFALGVLVATAFQRGWLRSPIDKDRAPRLPWGRHG